MAAALAVSSRDSHEHEPSCQQGPGPAGWTGTASNEYAPGIVELARRVVTVLGGRYSAELGIDVGVPMNIARRNAELYEVKINAVLGHAADPREMVDYS